MKLVTFVHNGATHLGALRTQQGQNTVIDLSQQPGFPTDMIGFLQAGESVRQLAEQALTGKAYPLADVSLKAPLPRPGKIICIGRNYREHALETKSEVPTYPIIFAKYSNTVIGPGESIVIPKVTEQVDYEAELGVVIGRRAKYVSEADALSYVGGYLPVNDVTARDYQDRISQWTLGKSFDTFGPMGPALVTADEIPDPQNLNIRLTIGGEVLQQSNTSNMLFRIPRLIATITEVMTLEPGDVIFTGTPPGVGMARTPKRWLRPGETVVVEIEGVGTLSNPVVAEEDAWRKMTKQRDWVKETDDKS
ncbi:MAG: fumarylacetoacetate hydrolase family protein [Aggregatilineales bacterium]